MRVSKNVQQLFGRSLGLEGLGSRIARTTLLVVAVILSTEYPASGAYVEFWSFESGTVSASDETAWNSFRNGNLTTQGSLDDVWTNTDSFSGFGSPMYFWNGHQAATLDTNNKLHFVLGPNSTENHSEVGVRLTNTTYMHQSLYLLCNNTYAIEYTFTLDDNNEALDLDVLEDGGTDEWLVVGQLWQTGVSPVAALYISDTASSGLEFVWVQRSGDANDDPLTASYNSIASFSPNTEYRVIIKYRPSEGTDGYSSIQIFSGGVSIGSKVLNMVPTVFGSDQGNPMPPEAEGVYGVPLFKVGLYGSMALWSNRTDDIELTLDDIFVDKSTYVNTALSSCDETP